MPQTSYLAERYETWTMKAAPGAGWNEGSSRSNLVANQVRVFSLATLVDTVVERYAWGRVVSDTNLVNNQEVVSE